jgi:CelD/BcsL family acetyltransferase involved in cellulose biosynthesis
MGAGTYFERKGQIDLEPLMNETIKTISIRIIDSDEEFIKLKDLWNGLLENSNADTIFLTWEWVWEWWRHFKRSKKLAILIAEEEGRLIGIAPFYTQKVRFFGLRSYTHLELCASTGLTSEYLDFILIKGRERELVVRFMDELFNNPDIRWDVLNLIYMKKESENLRWCREYCAENKKKVNIYDECPNFFINLPAAIDDLSKVLGKKMRVNARNYKIKLFGQYKTFLEAVTSPERHEENLADFIRLHQIRQQEKNEKGSFNPQRKQFLSFHSVISKILLEKGWCLFAFLNVNGERVAGQYNFIYKGRMHCYSVGFDPAWSEARVGNVLIYTVLEHAIENSYQEFDFLRGNPGDNEYKSRWTKDTRITVNAAVWRSDFTYSLVCLEKNIRVLVKSFFPKELAMKIYRGFFSRKEQ